MDDAKVYRIARAARDFSPAARWDADEWAGVEPGRIDVFPWDDNGWRPAAQFKLQYSPTHVHVIFHIEDRYVRCLTRRHGGAVWEDACVEFFFSPGSDVGRGYFNIETNCCGAALWGFQKGRDLDAVRVERDAIRTLGIATSLRGDTDREIVLPCSWSLAYRISVARLAARTSVVMPGPGVVWRANFYKCAENNSHPHWSCWSPISAPAPDFHRPEFFGTLVFD